jgi:hypothetical protein
MQANLHSKIEKKTKEKRIHVNGRRLYVQPTARTGLRNQPSRKPVPISLFTLLQTRRQKGAKNKQTLNLHPPDARKALYHKKVTVT